MPRDLRDRVTLANVSALVSACLEFGKAMAGLGFGGRGAIVSICLIYPSFIFQGFALQGVSVLLPSW
jgi:hypothetical protein